MSISILKDHEQQAGTLLLEQYRGKPRLEAWIRVYLRQVQLLEDAIYEVVGSRFLDGANDAQLDIIGRIVGEERLSRSNADYRTAIRVRILVNTSTGVPARLLGILSMLTAPTVVHFDEYYPASLLIEFVETPAHLGSVYRALQTARAGGVRLNFVSPTAPAATQFLYSSVGDTDVGDNGYSDANVVDTYGLLATALDPSFVRRTSAVID